MKRRSFPRTNYSHAKRSTYNKNVPSYKIVQGTKFAVDAFNYGYIENVDVYFLTHFHSDHYTGLSSNFNKTVYCSKITGYLCQKILKVDSRYIKIIDCDETHNINGINVTAIDANHCPGSIMLIFDLKNEKRILHCGDFRSNIDMERNYFLTNKKVDTIYLDTTYCNPKYDFPTQTESIEMALSALSKKKEAMNINNIDFSKLLIVCGTYFIGKEKFFMGIAEKLQVNVWCEEKKKKILDNILKINWGTSKYTSQLHVLSLTNISYEFLDKYMKTLSGKFVECIAFKPSGWEYGSKSFVQRGNISIFGIPYSEHSSFKEIKRFISFCKPNTIITTIPGHNKSKSVQSYLSSWIGNEPKKSQKKISDFFSPIKK